jgi:hypothetical protein
VPTTTPLLAIVALLSSACFTPSPLVMPAPPGSLSSAAEREQYLVDHGPLPAVEQRQPGLLVFADGQQTSEPKDLLRYVDARSPTATAANAAEDHRSTSNMWVIAGAAGLSMGGAVMLSAPFLLIGSSQSATSESEAMAASWPGLALFAAGATVMAASALVMIPSTLSLKEAEAERSTALALFERDLRRKLDLPVQPSRVATSE